jgi:curved DNA-binding protein CbpA
VKNYYKILQVDPEAEKEVIEAAHKRLMLKYHPDMLSEEQKADKTLLEKVQEINEAYDTLSNDKKRREYDQIFRAKPLGEKNSNLIMKSARPVSVLEKKAYLVKCSLSKKAYRMMLGRPQGTKYKFNILGFEPIETTSLPENTGGWLLKISSNLIKRSKKTFKTPQKIGSLPDEAINKLFESAININDVNWSGSHQCPSCGAEIKRADGTIVHWLVCGGCSRLFCVGNASGGLFDAFRTQCPWCGRRMDIRPKSSKKICGGLSMEKIPAMNKQKIRNDCPAKTQKN